MTTPKKTIAQVSDNDLVEDFENGLSAREIAEKHGVCMRSVFRRKAKLNGRITSEHSSVPGHSVPAGYKIKGISTLEHSERGSVMTWYKTTQDAEAREALFREAVKAIADDLPRYSPEPAPARGNSDLLNLYVLTDYHVGMLSWEEETGADWDVKIAEKLLVKWMGAAMSCAPDADTAVLCQLGDFLHFDGFDAVTPSSGHLLDADSRFQKLVRVAIRVLRACIDMLLKKHKKVHIVMAEGNHDMASSVWLSEMFDAVYDNEPRVTIDTRPDPYYCYEFGKTSLFFHHGHKTRPAQLDSVFAAKFREVFGRTEYSYGHCGHLHHHKSEESRLMIIEQHQTLAAKDAYASRGGWLSKRGAKVCTYHRNYGYVGDINITPEMLK